MSAGSFLTSQEQSVSPQNEPGTVWVNNKQMVWSLSKTNIPLVPAFPPQTENKALCDAWFILCKASHSFGPEELGCFFLWPDSYLPLFSSSHLSSCLLFHFSSCLPFFLLSFVVFHPLFVTGQYTGADSTGVCLCCDLYTTTHCRGQKAAACWLHSGFMIKQQHLGCFVVHPIYFLVTTADNIHKHHSFASCKALYHSFFHHNVNHAWIGPLPGTSLKWETLPGANCPWPCRCNVH